MAEKIPERASRSMLEVPIGAKRNQLDIEKDTWWAVAELGVALNFSTTAGAAVKTVGIETLLLPFFLSDSQTFSVHSTS